MNEVERTMAELVNRSGRCVLNAIISMILSRAIPNRAFPQVRHGTIFLIPGDVRNAKFSRQKKAFSSPLMNNIHFFDSSTGNHYPARPE